MGAEGALRVREIPEELRRRVPAEIALRYRILPLAWQDGALVVGMADPFNLMLLDELTVLLGCRVKGTAIPPAQLDGLVDRYYGAGAQTVAGVLAGLGGDEEQEEPAEGGEELAHQAPVVKLVNSIIAEALRRQASDVHLEPFEGQVRLRYRIDGVLHEETPPPRRLWSGVVSRIKVMAGLNIAERRLPQDGRFRLRLAGREVDVRVSTVPTVHGESVVLRLLDRASLLLTLSELGFSPEVQEAFQRLIALPHGLLLVTGPTGSGKTTTLYAALSAINTPEKKIITIEDPVEYQLPGVNQLQVKEKIGFTFARGLRHILRQDPDIVLVGEIRDPETARMAVQAALTGHLVFATLHTNDAAGAVTRLLDMGVEPYLVASTVRGLLAQRLVRVLCAECKTAYAPTPEERDALVAEGAGPVGRLYRPGGCPACDGTGYRGRTALYELMEVTPEISQLILTRPASRDVLALALRQGLVTLRQDGLRKAAAGVTSLAEVWRVTGE
ncbi:MAG TPA: type II secretion system ATPase GspE [Firmicutes bacterium]|nr:type II secretion system ATPase GspE [Bacillota bacterium]